MNFFLGGKVSFIPITEWIANKAFGLIQPYIVNRPTIYPDCGNSFCC